METLRFQIFFLVKTWEEFSLLLKIIFFQLFKPTTHLDIDNKHTDI